MALLDNCVQCGDCSVPIPPASFNECPAPSTGGFSYIFLAVIGNPIVADVTDSAALLAELQTRIDNASVANADTMRALKVINGVMPAPSDTTLPEQGCYGQIVTNSERTITFSFLELTQENLDFQLKSACASGIRALLWALDDNCVFYGGQNGIPVTIRGVHTFAGAGKTDLQTLDFTASWSGCSPQKTITTINPCAENFAFLPTP